MKDIIEFISDVMSDFIFPQNIMHWTSSFLDTLVLHEDRADRPG